MNNEIKEKIIILRSEGLGYKKIAKELNINLNSVKSFCRSNMLKDTKIGLTNCKYCMGLIDRSKRNKKIKFCNNDCRMRWWNINRDKINKKKGIDVVCKNCNKQCRFYKNANRKYCSHKCYIEHRFKGDKNG